MEVTMEMLRRMEPIALIIVFLGALNWGILGITGGETNVLAEVFGTGTFLDVLYVVVGISALVFVPRLMDTLRLGRGPHPRGA
jgi:uncharacterized membrane protein YuzA (DUF378 family)